MSKPVFLGKNENSRTLLSAELAQKFVNVNKRIILFINSQQPPTFRFAGWSKPLLPATVLKTINLVRLILLILLIFSFCCGIFYKNSFCVAHFFTQYSPWFVFIQFRPIRPLLPSHKPLWIRHWYRRTPKGITRLRGCRIGFTARIWRKAFFSSVRFFALSNIPKTRKWQCANFIFINDKLYGAQTIWNYDNVKQIYQSPLTFSPHPLSTGLHHN